VATSAPSAGGTDGSDDPSRRCHVLRHRRCIDRKQHLCERCRRERGSKGRGCSIISLCSRLVATFGEQSAWGSAAALLAFLRQCQARYQRCDYSCYLRGTDYLDGIIHVANALEFVRSTVRDSPSHFEVLDSLALFWGRWCAEIEQHELRRPMINAWLEMMKAFDGTIALSKALEGKSHEGVVICGLPGPDLALNALLCTRHDSEKAEFAAVFAKWVKPRRCAKHAAAVVDFLLRVRAGHYPLNVYSRREVQAAAKDRLIWAPLLQVAAPHFAKRLSGDTLRHMASMLELSNC
jgi:hypothetical protein